MSRRKRQAEPEPTVVRVTGTRIYANTIELPEQIGKTVALHAPFRADIVWFQPLDVSFQPDGITLHWGKAG